MSLLSSIFGETNETKEQVSTLFDETQVFSAAPKRKLSLTENDDDNDNEKKDGNADLKKESDEESSSSDSSSDDDGSEGKEKDKEEDNKNESSQAQAKVKENQATETKEETQQKKILPDNNNNNKADERTIFVGNLPNCFHRKQLEQLFRPCGPIDSTRIRSVATMGVKVPQTSAGNQKLVKKVSANTQKVDTEAKPSVVGYVVFKEPGHLESIEKALVMNNTAVPDSATGSTRRIRVDHSKTEFDSTRSIFCGSLPYRTDEETLRRHFCQQMDIRDEDIEGVRVVRDKETYQCKGFAYILFSDKAMVASALRLVHGSEYMKRELRVLVCTKRYNSIRTEKRPKKKNKGGEDADSVKPGVAALRRILEKEDHASQHNSKNKRARGKKSGQNGKMAVNKAGVSRRAASEAKANKRVKKLQKRITKGMGKTRTK